MLPSVKKINRHFYPKKLFYGPSWIVLGVNNVCNLHCKMCDVGTLNNETNFAQNLVGTKPLQMPMELFSRMADQCASHFPNTKLGYAFTEPLIYTHLEESLAYAKHKKLYTAVTTNALNLKQKADILVANDVADIFISLDGTEAVHNEIRGHKKSFQWAIEGIEKVLSKTQKINISIFCVITEWNTHNLLDFAEFFRKYPIKLLGFMHPNYTLEKTAQLHNSQWYGSSFPATHSNIEELDPTKIDLALLKIQMDEIRQRTYPYKIVFQPDLQTESQLRTFYHHPEIFIGKGCADVFENIMLKSDGTMIPAHGRCYNLPLGNLYQQSLPEIWNSKINANFRIQLKKNGGYFAACSRCCSAF